MIQTENWNPPEAEVRGVAIIVFPHIHPIHEVAHPHGGAVLRVGVGLLLPFRLSNQFVLV